MLELARADATTPYTASAASWYRFVAGLKRVRAAAAAPVIRFEGLAGEFLQVDWGEAWVPLGTEVVRRVFLAARLKYSRTLAVNDRVKRAPKSSRKIPPSRVKDVEFR